MRTITFTITDKGSEIAGSVDVPETFEEMRENWGRETVLAFFTRYLVTQAKSAARPVEESLKSRRTRATQLLAKELTAGNPDVLAAAQNADTLADWIDKKAEELKKEPKNG